MRKMSMKKNTFNVARILEDFNLIIPCAWVPDREIRQKEYVEMLTSFVQSYLKEKLDAKYLRSKESTDGSKQITEDL